MKVYKFKLFPKIKIEWKQINKNQFDFQFEASFPNLSNLCLILFMKEKMSLCQSKSLEI